MKKTNNDEFVNESSNESQCAAIKKYLEEGKKITPRIALDLCGCFRLAARIHDLRHKYGMNIIRDMVYRNGKKFAEYWLAA